MTTQPPMPETIENLGAAVFPSFAMLAGMQLELFTLLSNGPMDVGELAQTLDVGSTKLEHLLYSLVDSGLLIVEGQRFSNTAEADHYLVRGKATYM
ncbi:MAG: methyltransferase dimerization domain-containing protein, partial [Dehalococcoidia bacterium]